jgi:ABC-type sugar transport system ATPase subunit
VSFGAVRALDRVSLDLLPGEIHSLCGENGAGKSTLIKCLGGALQPTGGRVAMGGVSMPASVRAAESAGVAVIHQEPLAFPDLGAADTIFMAREPTRMGGLWLDRGLMQSRAKDLLASLGETFDTRRPVGGLPLAQRQMVAIARAMMAARPNARRASASNTR